jgi:hypothetical protein
VGCADVDNALQLLDKVTKEEALTVAAQALDAAHRFDGLVLSIASEVEGVESRVQRLEGKLNPYRDVLDSTQPYSTSHKYNINFFTEAIELIATDPTDLDCTRSRMIPSGVLTV